MVSEGPHPRYHEKIIRENSEASELGRLLAEIVGGSPIASLERQRSKFSSFYASDVVMVRLASGHKIKFFLKDFGSYDHPKDDLTGRRERERAVYRDILPTSGLSTTQYYGSV